MHIKSVYEKLQQKSFFADVEKARRPPPSTHIKYKTPFPKSKRDLVDKIREFVDSLNLVEQEILIIKWYEQHND